MKLAYISIEIKRTSEGQDLNIDIIGILGSPYSGYNENPGYFSRYWKSITQAKCEIILPILFNNTEIIDWTVKFYETVERASDA